MLTSGDMSASVVSGGVLADEGSLMPILYEPQPAVYSPPFSPSASPPPEIVAPLPVAAPPVYVAPPAGRGVDTSPSIPLVIPYAPAAPAAPVPSVVVMPMRTAGDLTTGQGINEATGAPVPRALPTTPGYAVDTSTALPAGVETMQTLPPGYVPPNAPPFTPPYSSTAAPLPTASVTPLLFGLPAVPVVAGVLGFAALWLLLSPSDAPRSSRRN